MGLLVRMASFSFFRNLQRLDWLLILAAFVLFAFGIATITSVELSRGAEQFIFVRKQLIALSIGLAVFTLAASVNYQVFRAYGRIVYFVAISLLIAGSKIVKFINNSVK